MALYYGYSSERNDLTRVLRYPTHYGDMFTTTYRDPKPEIMGYPSPKIYGCGLTPKSKIILLSHIFDDDNVLGDELKLSYELILRKRDGTSESFDMFEITMVDKKIYAHNYLLNEEIVISDLYKGNLWDIVFMEVRFRRTSTTGGYGNESLLDILVEY